MPKKMQNCPSTANTCPSRKHQARSDFRKALDTENFRAMDALEVNEDTYRQSLLAIREILVDGCDQCARNAVIWLANDMKWPPTREYQLILVDELLRRSLQRAARVH